MCPVCATHTPSAEPAQREPSASVETPLTNAESRYAWNIEDKNTPVVTTKFARDLEQQLRASEEWQSKVVDACRKAPFEWSPYASPETLPNVLLNVFVNLCADRDAAQSELTRLKDEMRVMRKLIFHILHQRTGPMGLKVEDDLIRENEPLYRKALEAALQP